MEKIQYYINHRLEREQQILAALSDNPSKLFDEEEIVEMIYKDTPAKLKKAAAHNVNHHLKKLLKEQRVKEVNGLWQHNPLCCRLIM